MDKKTSIILLLIVILIGLVSVVSISVNQDLSKTSENLNSDLNIDTSSINNNSNSKEYSNDNNTSKDSNSSNNVEAVETTIGNNSIHYEASGYCYKVVDGDTIWVEGVGKIRFVGVNTPEKKETGYSEAKEFVKEKCLYKTVYLDIDDKKNKDKYNRTLAIVYTDKGENLNKELLQYGYGEVMYYPPSEFPKGLGVA